MRKLFQNKIVIMILFAFDIMIFFLGLSFSIEKEYYLLIYFLIHLLGFVLFFSCFLKIPIIHWKKWYHSKKRSEIRKQLEIEEKYMEELEIATFDGSGSLTHPSVLYFENKWNGYHYWMAYTPYDNNNVELENPCIAVSNDGIHFSLPSGVKNPLLEMIKKEKPYTFYNDPFLLFTNQLELWYRYTIEDQILVNEVYRITSKDGVNWSKPEKIIDNDDSCYMSFSIVKKDQKYYLYYFDLDYQFNVRYSKDLLHWSKEEVLFVEGLPNCFWHGEVRYQNQEFQLLVLDNHYQLFLAKSKNGRTFQELFPLKIEYSPKEYFYKNQVIYKSSILEIKDYIYLYIPVRITTFSFFKLKGIFHKKWKLTITILKKNHLNLIQK